MHIPSLCRIHLRFLFCTLSSLVSPLPLPFFALGLPHRLVAEADALLDMDNIDASLYSLLFHKLDRHRIDTVPLVGRCVESLTLENL
jgi:hypothetical protein